MSQPSEREVARTEQPEPEVLPHITILLIRGTSGVLHLKIQVHSVAFNSSGDMKFSTGSTFICRWRSFVHVSSIVVSSKRSSGVHLALACMGNIWPGIWFGPDPNLTQFIHPGLYFHWSLSCVSICMDRSAHQAWSCPQSILENRLVHLNDKYPVEFNLRHHPVGYWILLSWSGLWKFAL